MLASEFPAPSHSAHAPRPLLVSSLASSLFLDLLIRSESGSCGLLRRIAAHIESPLVMRIPQGSWEVVKEDHRSNPPIFHQGFQESSDCCVSYASQIPCSRFIYYFSTSGGCSMPGIIFITKKGKQVCANPSDPRVQNCLSTLSQVPRSGNKLIAWEGGHALPSAFFCLPRWPPRRPQAFVFIDV